MDPPACQTRPRHDNVHRWPLATHPEQVGFQIALKERAYGVPGRNDIDDGVPEPHEGQNDRSSVAEGERHCRRVREGVDSIDGGRELIRI